jgi:glutamate--cysteine ligase
MGTRTERPIASEKELFAYFEEGCKHPDRLQIGVEHEKVGVLADGHAPGYDLIEQLLTRMSTNPRGRGWRTVFENGTAIAIEQEGGGSITLEPGGQIEHSGAPFSSATEAAADNDRHTDEISRIAADLGITFIGVGFRPFGTLEEVPWMPKGRYRVMRAYLPTRGSRAHEMMKRTATVQANLDYVDEADAMEKLRLGLGLSPLVTALFAASPLIDGRPSGFQSYRSHVWLDTDPDRCGLLPFVFEKGAGFRDYVEWALDVPMFFVHRGDEYRAAHVPFRKFLRDGIDGERATIGDWSLHLSTLFPETRLKRYIEVRQADAGSREMVRALPALWQGLFYDRAAREASWALVSDLTWDERMSIYRDAPKFGLSTRIRGRLLGEVCGELVAIANEALLRLGSPAGAALLEPLFQIVSERRTLADRILEMHQKTGGEPKKMMELLRL